MIEQELVSVSWEFLACFILGVTFMGVAHYLGDKLFHRKLRRKSGATLDESWPFIHGTSHQAKK